MSAPRKLLALVVSGVIVVAIAGLSRVPGSHSSGNGLVRLSWRLQGVTVEECRTLSEEELAERPVHMRNPDACIGRIADYELRVGLDDREALIDTVSPAGARGDRPIYVLRDIPVTPGTHEVRVTFRALVPESFDGGARPLSFEWSDRPEVQPREIVLVTLDESSSRLIRRTGR